MKKIIPIFSAALVLMALSLGMTSCSKSNAKSSLVSLSGTSWVCHLPNNSNIMSLEFSGSGVTMRCDIKSTDGKTYLGAIVVTGTYTYTNPDFDATFTSGRFDIPDQKMKALVEELYGSYLALMQGELPGTVSTDGMTLTTKGDTPRTFSRN